MDEPTKEILVAVASREESACAALIESVEPMARAALVGWKFDSRDDREDVLQLVRIEVIEHVAEYDPARGKFAAWVYGIVRNVARSHLRTRSRRPETPFSQQPEGFDPADEKRVEVDELPPSRLVSAFRNVYEELADQDRLVVDHILAHEAGVARHEDLALILGKSTDATKQAVYRMKLKLKRLIEKELQNQEPLLKNQGRIGDTN